MTLYWKFGVWKSSMLVFMVKNDWYVGFTCKFACEERYGYGFDRFYFSVLK